MENPKPSGTSRFALGFGIGLTERELIMSDGVKAFFVVGGLFAFFLVPVAGPGLETGVGTLLQVALGSDDQRAAENKKTRGDARYGENGHLKQSLDCCKGCDLEWDFVSDRCVTDSQAGNNCYMTCRPSP